MKNINELKRSAIKNAYIRGWQGMLHTRRYSQDTVQKKDLNLESLKPIKVKNVILIWAKYLKNSVTKNDMQMTNKHMNVYSVPLVITENKLKSQWDTASPPECCN